MRSERDQCVRIRPDRETFKIQARRYSVVPVWREILADLITPVAAFARLVGDRPGFLLESVEHGNRWSRWSFIGRNPQALLVARDGRVEASGAVPEDLDVGRGMLAALEDLLGRHRAPTVEGLPPLHSGLVGYLGYDLVREVERLPDVPRDDRGYPDAIMALLGDVAVFDHWRQRVTLIANVVVPAGAGDAELDRCYDDAVARVGQLAADGAAPLAEPLVDPPDPAEPLPAVRPVVGEAAYCQAVEVAKEHILAGDIFQVVLSERFDFDLGADPFDVYRVLRQVNPSPYMYFLRYPELTLVGASPEPMVRVQEGRVISRPIAGTRRRGRTDEDDRRLAAELREHPKEIAEHVMLVDLARNDLGRIVTFGTERVDELMTLELYSHVMHLTSQVSGELRPGTSVVDVLRATMPAGTLSGAPKVRAMEIIDALEPVKRGPYGGVVGYLDLSGSVDTAITIRTMYISGDRASVQAGAGVVADSEPAHEYLECRNKAQALLAAVPAARRMTARREGRDG